MKKIIAMILCVVCLSMSFSVYATTNFSDFNEQHWAYDYVDSLVSGKIINGYPDGTFKPENTTSRAEFFKMMAVTEDDNLAVEEYSGELFNWYDPYVEYIYSRGMNMIGMSRYNADDSITRKEAVMVLANFAEYNGILDNFYFEEHKDFNAFTDIDNFTDIEKYLLNYAYTAGIITGYPDGTFGPDRTMTRAEVATILCRFCVVWTEAWEQ